MLLFATDTARKASIRNAQLYPSTSIFKRLLDIVVRQASLTSLHIVRAEIALHTMSREVEDNNMILSRTCKDPTHLTDNVATCRLSIGEEDDVLGWGFLQKEVVYAQGISHCRI